MDAHQLARLVEGRSIWYEQVFLNQNMLRRSKRTGGISLQPKRMFRQMNTKLRLSECNFGPLLAHPRNAIRMVFRWRADSGPLLHAYWDNIRPCWPMYYQNGWRSFLWPFLLQCQWRSQNAEKIRTTKGDYCIKQCLSTITSLFKMGTSLPLKAVPEITFTTLGKPTWVLLFLLRTCVYCVTGTTPMNATHVFVEWKTLQILSTQGFWWMQTCVLRLTISCETSPLACLSFHWCEPNVLAC